MLLLEEWRFTVHSATGPSGPSVLALEVDQYDFTGTVAQFDLLVALIFDFDVANCFAHRRLANVAEL